MSYEICHTAPKDDVVEITQMTTTGRALTGARSSVLGQSQHRQPPHPPKVVEA